MAFALHLQLIEESHYIHKQFLSEDKDAPRTTRNMNFAYLFESESVADRFKKRHGLPVEWRAKFIPVSFPTETPEQTAKRKYYTTLNRGKLEDEIPDFFKEV